MDLNLNSDFDFQSFWTKGGFSLDLSTESLAHRLAQQISEKETYSLSYNEKIPVEMCHWETNWDVPEKPPAIYGEFKDYLLDSRLFKSYYQLYGKFTFTKMMLHRTPRSYINNYHSHSFDGSHLHVFFYVAPEPRDVNDGGLIELGEVVDKDSIQFDSHSFYHRFPKLHSTHSSFVPRSCLALVVNNLNPFFRHRVTEVFSAKKRYTFMLAFGYKDNCAMKGEINHL